MLKRLNTLVVPFVVLFLLLSGGCIEDQCTAVQCRNKGVCVRGKCACTFGYEGDFCELKWYQKFEGTWKATEKDKKEAILAEYEVINIDAGGIPDTFYLLNLAGHIDTVTCVRASYRTFSMLEKSLNDTFKLASGEGELSNDGLSVIGLYSLSQNDVITNVGYTWTK